MTEARPVARTGLGDVMGRWQDGVAVFRGVRYAAPPVGERRFAAPAPYAPSSGITEAVEHGPISLQPPSRLRAAMGDFARPQDEDCLTLTIWTPSPDAAAARPVVVWLHGGAYMSGAGSLDWYDGSALARAGDIVVVGVNYRLGACGFLSRPGLSDGNAGLFDQQAALLWVAEHITAFGGDPRRVTLMGQSAGGGSIAFLLTQPSARGLFQRAILQSPALAPPIAAPEAAARGDRFLDLLGIEKTASDAVARARAVPAAQLLDAQGMLVRALASEDSLRLPFGPVAPEAMRPGDYLDAVAEGAKTKDILIGCTREEMHAFFAADPTVATLDRNAAAARAKAITGDPQSLDAYRERRPGGSLLDAVADLTTDHRFILPSQNLAAAIARRGGKVWTYRFDWSPPSSEFKACHCIEIPFIFGNFAAWREAPMLAGGDRGEMERLSFAMQQSWIAFVRNGDPGHAGIPAWPRQEGDRPMGLHFDRAPYSAHP